MKNVKAVFMTVMLLMVTLAVQAQKTYKVKSAEDFIKAIGPNRIIEIDSEQALNITAVLNHYMDIGKVVTAPTYYYNGEECYPEMPDIEEDEDPSALMPDAYEEGDDDVLPDESGMDEATEDDLKMQELVGFRPENVKVEVFKAKRGGKPLQHVFYRMDTDGVGLEIRDCPNLTIRAKGEKATLLARPRYVNVIEFTKCDGLKLQNLVLGHTLEGSCTNGVIRLNVCDGVEIEGCDLFGCGTEGISVDYSKNVTMRRSQIHDCSYSTMHIDGSEMVRFLDCRFYRNKEFEQLNCSNSTGVNFVNCSFENLRGKLFNLQCACNFNKCTFTDCNMHPISEAYVMQDNAVLRDCKTVDVMPTPKAQLLSDLKEKYESFAANFTKYLVIDLDEDGRDEILLYGDGPGSPQGIMIYRGSGNLVTSFCVPDGYSTLKVSRGEKKLWLVDEHDDHMGESRTWNTQYYNLEKIDFVAIGSIIVSRDGKGIEPKNTKTNNYMPKGVKIPDLFSFGELKGWQEL